MSLTNHEFVMNGKLELNDFPTADNDSQIPDDFLARSKNDIGPVTPTCGSSDKDVARNRLAYISFLSGSAPASDPDPTAVVKQVVTAVGGEDKLLRLFRTRETVNASSDPEKKVPERVSVNEPPKYWWTGKNERVKNEVMPDESATFLVWAWTLGILADPASKLEVIPDVVESDKPAIGLRVSGTVTPPMDLYFDKAESRLIVRVVSGTCCLTTYSLKVRRGSTLRHGVMMARCRKFWTNCEWEFVCVKDAKRRRVLAVSTPNR